AIGSSLLMQRSSVLLPDPLGPQMTTTSPRAISRSMPFRTCNPPKYLLTPRNVTIGNAAFDVIATSVWARSSRPGEQATEAPPSAAPTTTRVSGRCKARASGTGFRPQTVHQRFYGRGEMNVADRIDGTI